VLAAFFADSLALGAHWVYDSDLIKEKLGTVNELLAPTLNNYHAGKTAGDFTHYGDQTLWLLESIAAEKKFDAPTYFAQWLKAFETYSGYKDGASKKTLENVAEKLGGSDSHDLAGVSRIAPLFVLPYDEDALAEAAIQQTKLTHNNDHVLEAADLFARVGYRIIHNGQTPVHAIEEVTKLLASKYPDIQALVQKGLDSKDTDDETAIRSFGEEKTYGTNKIFTGKACAYEGSLPGTVHFVARYESLGVEPALVANVGVGGDSAARGMLIGALLGAYHGPSAIPARHLSKIRQYEHIQNLLASL